MPTLYMYCADYVRSFLLNIFVLWFFLHVVNNIICAKIAARSIYVLQETNVFPSIIFIHYKGTG
jgi:hypothetical protein